MEKIRRINEMYSNLMILIHSDFRYSGFVRIIK